MQKKLIKQELVQSLKKFLNGDSTRLNSHLKVILESLSSIVDDMSENHAVIGNSYIEYILAYKMICTDIINVNIYDRDSIKLTDNELKPILDNAELILKRIEIIERLQNEILKTLSPEEILIVMNS